LFLDVKNDSHDLFIELGLQGGKLVISLRGKETAFSKPFCQDGIGAVFELIAGLSVLRDFTSGSGGLEINVPTHLNLGPVELQSITIGAQPQDGSIPVNAGASIKTSLGPVTVD
jgi:hypothetical protein